MRAARQTRGSTLLLWNTLSNPRKCTASALLFVSILLHHTRLVFAELIADMPGQIILGGIFPLHEKIDYSCGPIRFDRGIQRAEAMLFALDKVNNDSTILPGITLGAKLVDSCSLEAYALNQSLTFIRGSLNSQDTSDFICMDGTNPRPKSNPVPLVGVVGESYSSVTIQVANLLRLFAMPQISPAATSDTLSDKQRYEYFARTVPPDKYQAKALVDIITMFNWTYVSYVASEDEYGQKGIEMFMKEARARNICIAAAEKIPFSPNMELFDEIIKNLRAKKKARVVVVFVKQEHAQGLMLAAKRANLHNDGFIWLGTDQWGIQRNVVAGSEQAATGAITIELQSKRSVEFDDYLVSLYPGNPKIIRNPWFLEFWETNFGCKVKPTIISSLWFNDPQLSPYVMTEDRYYKWRNRSWDYCAEDMRLNKNYAQDSKVPFVIDAVLAFAKALHALLEDNCLAGDIFDATCSKKLRVPPIIDGRRLYQYILNVSFTDKTGHKVEFDQNGDGLGRYDLYNFQKTENGTFRYFHIGEWVETKLIIQKNLQWPRMAIDKDGPDAGRPVFDTNGLPLSRCSDPCKKGYVKVVQDDKCCWVCIACKPYEYVVSEAVCRDCGLFRWPTYDLTDCFDLPLQHMEWHQLWAIVPMVVACLGGVLTGFVIVVFIKHNDTPLVRASGRELSYLILGGIMMCYCLTFFLIAYPSPIICAFQRFGVGFGFSIMYSALLTKTNRISRIFESASKSAKRPGFISPKSQLIITSILISVQVIANIIWLIIDPANVDKSHPEGRRDEVVLKCKTDDSSFLISLAYNMLLIVTCTIYAVKTRKIPENFNESKFIGFTMYTTCIIWLAFVPIYFGTQGNFKVQITTLSISISLSASTCLLCLFSPKIYIIVFHPEKNVRKLTMNTTTTYKKANSSVTTSANNHAPGITDNPRVTNNIPAAVNITQRLTETSEPDSITSL
ncbi:metabotropic glutamate receptor-like [Paramacrobiotus metropolitanus]|uniref:metabotropic glutamate receptor-like n=1 Tax=Paramacrobiotus metropolitanus TaxID=2943436 RepID=UPI0024459480|nr:metabotropic glutamate receptor-like [Paramacrobiotus metropolitanus]XP_055353330.1 metabotropic glutamate receptor-like [Paramacrobiotus metropolitanus]